MIWLKALGAVGIIAAMVVIYWIDRRRAGGSGG